MGVETLVLERLLALLAPTRHGADRSGTTREGDHRDGFGGVHWDVAAPAPVTLLLEESLGIGRRQGRKRGAHEECEEDSCETDFH